jgi:hypothetical protein
MRMVGEMLLRAAANFIWLSVGWEIKKVNYFFLGGAFLAFSGLAAGLSAYSSGW